MQALSSTTTTTGLDKRQIGKLEGQNPGPTLVVFGGIHGNEPAGVLALNRVFEQLEDMEATLNGTFIGLAGNMAALKEGRRFLHTDLNRIWNKEAIERAWSNHPERRTAEEKEMLELSGQITDILKNHEPPFYFIDLHTTSSKSLPFITINDALINRKFAQCFPTPIILGIEEYLQGPLLSYLNEEGFLALGFESGQHQEEEAIERAEAFIWMVLAHSGFLARKDVPDYEGCYQQLHNSAEGDRKFYEITYRHFLNTQDNFKMKEGFYSFQKVKKGVALATYNGNTIYLKKDNILFMPLYQKLGEDGYFLIRRIPVWAMLLSEWLRRLRIEGLLLLLPGVRRHETHRSKLEINLRWAPVISKQFFHLMGYRHRYLGRDKLILSNRERTSRKGDYKKCPWYSGKADDQLVPFN